MKLNYLDIANMIDLSAVQAHHNEDDVRTLAQLAIQYQCIAAFTLPGNTSFLKKELVDLCRQEIGPIAKPDIIQWAPGLPKTRSGKIMRRILRKIAENDINTLGDTSTLADPAVVDHLIENRANK
jgi:acyl-coenzyme A synthetase/AMP-(fatty) acid ligase